jgi:5-methylcytosine-specific restriction endonuclease McrA
VESGRACTKCGISKPFTEFSKEPRNKSGFCSSCKDCNNSRSKANYEANREERLKYQRQYHADNADQAREYARKWRKKNRDKIKVYRKTFVNRHREKELARNRIKSRIYRQEHPEKVRQWSRDYIRRHPERVALKNHNRRVKGKEFVVTEAEIAKIYASSCAHCNSSSKMTIDHIVPLSRGGKHSIGNLQPLCQSCNYSKSNKTLTEWLKTGRK